LSAFNTMLLQPKGLPQQLSSLKKIGIEYMADWPKGYYLNFEGFNEFIKGI